MDNLQHILQHLFQKDNLQEVPVETLEQFSREHPLFAAGHYLLTRKYQETGDEQYQRQLQKTALHYHNPLLLHYQLTKENSRDEISAKEIEEPAVRESNNSLPDAEHDLFEEVVMYQEMIPDPLDEVRTADPVNPADSDQSNKLTAGDIIEFETNGLKTNNLYHSTEDLKAIEEDAPSEAEQHSADADSQPEIISEPAALRPDVSNEAPREQVKDQLEEWANDSVPPVALHPLFARIKDEDNTDKPTFEPFHTVDYFASQGIKVSGDIKPDDKLGKQLKSFTEWLKTMRRLPEATVEAELEKTDDREIQKIAAHSLEENEVVTEAMAEVLVKQGRREHAAAIYRKLSLLNPDKSAYFAAKIDDLKPQ